MKIDMYCIFSNSSRVVVVCISQREYTGKTIMEEIHRRRGAVEHPIT